MKLVRACVSALVTLALMAAGLVMATSASATDRADATAGPNFAIEVGLSPTSVAGGESLQVSVTVSNTGAGGYGAGLIGVQVSWPTSSFSFDSGAAHSPLGCVSMTAPTTGTPDVSSRECAMSTLALDQSGTGQFSFWLKAVGIPPTSDVVAATVAHGLVPSIVHSGYDTVALAPADVVTAQTFTSLEPVFALDVSVDRPYGSARGAPIRATFTVTHEPYAAPAMDASVVQVEATWPTFLTLLTDPKTVSGCGSTGLVNGFCTITEPTSVRTSTTFSLDFGMPASGGGSGSISFYGMGGSYTPHSVIKLAGSAATDPVIRTASFRTQPRESVGIPGVQAAAASNDIPTTWMGIDSAAVTVADLPFPIDVSIDPDASWPGGDAMVATITITHGDGAPFSLPGLKLALQLTWPDFLQAALGPLAGCESFDGGTCVVAGLDEQGSSVTITQPFEPPGDTGFGEASAIETAASLVSDSGSVDLPDEWLSSDDAAAVVDGGLFVTTVSVDRPSGWVAGPDVAVTVDVRYAHTPLRESDEPFVGLEFAWPAGLSLDESSVAGCYSFEDDICTITGFDQPGDVESVTFRLRMPTSGDGFSGSVDATAAFVRDGVPGDSGELPAAWLVPGSVPFRVDTASFPVDVMLDHDRGTPAGTPLVATIRVTYESGPRTLDVGIVVGLALSWPDFLGQSAEPQVTGCATFDGSLCTLEGPSVIGQAKDITITFAMPEAGIGVGDITATAAFLRYDGGRKQLIDLPTDWLGSDSATFLVIDGSFPIDLELDRSVGYTGGKQLTATTTITHLTTVPAASDADLDGLRIELDFDWPGYLALSARSGCNAVVGQKTCIITGLDAPGASRVVTLTFAMPMTTPGAAVTPPQVGLVKVVGSKLSFLAPAPVAPPPPVDPDPPVVVDPDCDEICPPDPDCGDLCPTPSPTPTPSPEPEPAPDPAPATVTVDLPTSWIGSDRARFTLFTPSIRFLSTIAKPGDVVAALAQDFPPGAAVVVTWRLLDGEIAGSVPVTGLASGSGVARWPTPVLRWVIPGQRLLSVHSVDGQFGDVTPARNLLVVPRTSVGPKLIGRGG